MKNKNIWIALVCIFLVVCAACAVQIIKQNNENKYEETLNTEIPAENIEIYSGKNQESTDNQDNSKEENKSQNAQNIQEIASENEQKQEQTIEENSKDNKVNNQSEQNKEATNENISSTFEINPETGLDKYNTEPVPEGKPLPTEWQEVDVNSEKELTCTLSVSCKSILDNLDNLNPDKKDIVPEDGIIFTTQEVTFYEGESVFNVLLREMKKNKTHMEFAMTPLYNSNYIEGIANLYEFDCGELSGWMYKVNGWFPNYGCSRYKLEDKDIIEWVYTCDLGRDIGNSFMEEE